ncbi:MAG: hypothetical protein A2252_08070 [Elusimicrobia bacterium RIFOXYA2_FULL_39_19]|nr:MAG: hypothetical protein A2252_08070 [Elusimicrobia bacterium RIFOXYA2_FULL_39_19]
MKSRALSFLLAFVFWVALTWSLDWQYLLTGVIISLFIAWAVGDILTRNPWKFKQHARYIWAVYYIWVFIWEMVKGNIDGAYRILHPGLPIKPGIVKVKTNLRSDSALTYLANTITLTPGTFTVDVDSENGYLYVHWMNVETEDIDKATEIIIGKYEKILGKIFE